MNDIIRVSATTRDQIRSFLAQVWKGNGDGYCFVASKAPSGAFREQCIKHVDDLDLSMIGTCDMYFCPTRFDEPHRQRQYAQKSRWLHVDIDHPWILSLALWPSIHIETSHHHSQLLWRLRQRHEVEQVEGWNRALAQMPLLKGDHCHDITRYLRIPGTWNFKRRPAIERVKFGRHSQGLRDVIDFGALPKARAAQSGTVARDCEPISGSVPLARCMKRYGDLPTLRGPSVRTYANTDPSKMKRSDIVWAIASTLSQAGASPAELETIVRSSRAFQSKHEEYGDSYGENEIKRLKRKLYGN